ncbi:MAG: polyhydroxyalkanoate synthesis repressor PhaR [Alphaproteobacteria bacterium]
MIIIKKYANRRLYNTETSDYITLNNLYDLVKNNIDFKVIDAKTEEDLTRQTLIQIIFEREGSVSENILPLNFLKQLIRFYDDSLKNILPHYLEISMSNFVKNQENMRKIAEEYINNFSPFNFFEEVTKNNLKLFETTMNSFFSNKK